MDAYNEYPNTESEIGLATEGREEAKQTNKRLERNQNTRERDLEHRDHGTTKNDEILEI